MVRHIRQIDNTPTIAGDDLGFGRLGSARLTPVSSLHIHFRAQKSNKRIGIESLENHNYVDAGQRCQQLGAILLGNQWAPGLARARRGVAVQTHDQCIPLPPGALQISYVPHVEQIEVAIGHHNTSTRLTLLITPDHGTLEVENFSQRYLRLPREAKRPSPTRAFLAGHPVRS
jgi:hypothetical protein